MLKRCLFLLATFSTCFAQQLDLKQIMDDPYWIGEVPSNLHVSHDGKWLYFQIPRAMPHDDVWMKLPVTGGDPQEVSADELPFAMATSLEPLDDNYLGLAAGTLWLFAKDEPSRPLVSVSGGLRYVRTLDNGDVVVRHMNNLYAVHPDKGKWTQLTDIRSGKKSEPETDYYRVEERKLLRYVDRSYEDEESEEADRKKMRRMGSLLRPEPTYLGAGMNLSGRSLTADISPDGTYLVVIAEPSSEAENTEYAEFIDQDTFLEANAARPRVGPRTKTWTLGIENRESNKITWVDFAELPEIEVDRLADIKAELSEEDQRFLPKMEGPRAVFFSSGGFHPDHEELLVTVYTRDYKDRWIVLIDPTDGSWKLLDHHTDEAWVQSFTRGAGPQGQSGTAAFWRKDGQRVMFISDQDGYQHLYEVNPAGGDAKDLTPGNFEIYSPFESADGTSWYFHANNTHPGERHFYRMPINGGDWTAFTEEAGQHEVATSPDNTVMAALFSRTNHPPVIRVKVGNEAWETVYDGRSDAFKAIDWMEPEVLSYTNRDGKQVYARLYKPDKPNGAGVVFVHGAGYLQNAHKGWSGYFREYMFHNMLVREGYTVLDPDYQASAGYGRDWRTAIYRYMGDKDLNDVVDGAKYLTEQQGVDAERIGVYGGSYGGFITLMAMFTAPDTFRAGAALRPVTDWAFYNNWYTSRILNTPQEDPVAYRRSSPIYFAEGLKHALLICHGMVDSNVHYQDSVRLAQRLIELRKHNWELSSYPVEPHGFRTPSGWYDEYRRIYELMRENLSER